MANTLFSPYAWLRKHATTTRRRVMSRSNRIVIAISTLLVATAAHAPAGETKKSLQPMDVFKLEYADDPRVSPDGKQIVYVRNFMDVMKDRQRANLWVINTDGTGHEALTTGNQRDGSPRWSPDGKRLLYISDASGTPQLHVRWLDSQRSAQITHLTSAPLAPSWSPDGKTIAFIMHVNEPAKPFIEMPAKPEGAEWAPPMKMTRKLTYRFDGKGYLQDGYLQLFVVSAEGGAPRQLTDGPYNHGGRAFDAEGPAWMPDGKSLIFAANRHPEGEYNPLDSEIYAVSLSDGRIRALTDRRGPDTSPAVSPDGKHIAYVGFDDRQQGYQLSRLYVMASSGKNSRLLTDKLDRSVRSPIWQSDGKGIYFLFDDEGDTKVGYVSLDKEWETVTRGVGGTTLGRPYASGSFSLGGDGR